MILFVLWSHLALASTSSIPNLLTEYKNNFFQAESALRTFDKELDLALEKKKNNFLATASTYPQLLGLRSEREELKEKIIHQYIQALDSRRKNIIPPLRPLDHIALHDLLVTINKIHKEKNIKIPNELLTFSSQDLINARNIYSQEFEQAVKSASPNTSKLYPSPGQDGNMMGTDFPPNTYALTYDDGPSDLYTIPILENLLSHKKKATFFWLAENIERLQSIVDKVGQAGMSLQNHSYTHAQLTKLKAPQLRREIISSQELQSISYGETPKFFRCPYGAGTNVARIRQMIAEQKMIHVFWTIDTLDWQDQKPNSILERTKKEMALEKRGIILFHDIHPQSLEASKLLLDYSDTLENTEEKIRWVTIPEIAEELNAKP